MMKEMNKEKLLRQSDMRRTQSAGAQIWKRFTKNKGAVLGLVMITVIIIVAIASNFVFDYDTDVVGINSANRLKEPSAEHWFGTDALGRDVFARVCWGAQYSLVIGIGGALISLLIGSFIGAVAAFIGGWVEEVIMRIVEILLMVPGILITVLIVYCLGTSVPNLILALGVSTIPHFARNARAAVVTVRGNEYIESSRAIGSTGIRTLFSHVLPNALSPILVQATSRVAGCIIDAAGFSFLGLGIPAPLPEWGAMLVDARQYMTVKPYLIIIPGIAIILTVLAINQIGDGLRDALDPKLKR